MMTQEEKISADIPENPEALRKEIDRLLGDLTVKLLRDPQAQQTMLSVAGTVMSTWSAGNPLKKIVSFLALKTLPNLPPAENNRSADIAADLGRLMMRRWMLQTLESKNNPTAAGDRLTAFVKSFLDNTDISEWKTMLEASKNSRIETARQLNDLLAAYQGKILVIMAALPVIISIGSNSLKSYMETQLKVMPPEMVFEIFSGLNGRINWKEVGQMLNNHYELVRRIHIGSSLGGDGITPALRNLTGDILKGIVSEIDPQRYVDAMAGKAENREAVKNAVSDMMHAFPDFGKKMVVAAALSRNAGIRGMKNRLQVLADLPGDDLDDVVNEFTDAFDELELADLVSLITGIANTAYAGNPERIPQTVSNLVASIDMDEVRDLAESDLIRDMGKAIKPLAQILMPPLIHGFCDLLTPDSKETNPELQAALNRLNGIMGDSNANQ